MFGYLRIFIRVWIYPFGYFATLVLILVRILWIGFGYEFGFWIKCPALFDIIVNMFSH